MTKVYRKTTLVSFDAQDDDYVKRFMAHEIYYFNSVLAVLSSRQRTMSDLILEFSGNMEQFFGEVAAYGKSIRQVTSDNIPANLEPFKAVMFNEKSEMILSERMLLVLDALTVTTSCPSEVRKAIALSMLRFFRDQVSLFNKSRNTGVMRGPLTTIERLSASNRRHVQLPRSAVKVSYDDGKTTIKIPYARNPIVINGDLSKEKWNLLVIRQNHKGWVVEATYEPSMYLLQNYDHPIRTTHNKTTRYKKGMMA